MEEKSERGFLQTVEIAGDEFLGRWFDSWLPKESERYKRLLGEKSNLNVPFYQGDLSVFQGIRRDIYLSGLTDEPFSKPLLDKETIEKYKRFDKTRVSVFPDGTAMMFKQIL
jgi:hypothetical protein